MDRAATLQDLVEFRRPANELSDELAGYDWDSDLGIVVLDSSQVRSVLDRYLDGRLTAGECREWAELVFGRDDIALQPGRETLLKDVLFWMSEPEINGPMSPELARAHMNRLRGA